MAKAKKTVKKAQVHKNVKKPWWLSQVSLPFAVVIMLIAAIATILLVKSAFNPLFLSDVFSHGDVAGASITR